MTPFDFSQETGSAIRNFEDAANSTWNDREFRFARSHSYPRERFTGGIICLSGLFRVDDDTFCIFQGGQCSFYRDRIATLPVEWYAVHIAEQSIASQ
jgi:hypothetical protein